MVGKPLYGKYQVLKSRLFTHEYSHWATAFPGGNDHGPGHIERVLEKLDQLLGRNPIGRASLRPYELFLAMMSILYHDIGLLVGRAGHADFSALLVAEEHNDYLVDVNDRDIISAAVVSHSSTKDIAEETARFSDEELIGGQAVRPRVIAALVRLADELDEDFRRADPIVQRRMNIPPDSQFFWEFCQRIRGIQPDRNSHIISVDIKFTEEDVNRNVVVHNRPVPFIVAAADKISKINKERMTVNNFLPEALRYNHINVSVKPLPGSKDWKTPRSFVFGDGVSSTDFIAAFPEFLAKPANDLIREALHLMRAEDLDHASLIMAKLGDVVEYVPYLTRLHYFYNNACLLSIKADRAEADEQQKEILQASLTSLYRWIEVLSDGRGRPDESDSYLAIYYMARDNDLHCLLSSYREEIIRQLPDDLRKAIPGTVPERSHGIGCFPHGSLVATPNGEVPIEEIREGDRVLSIDLSGSPITISTRVLRVRAMRQAKCICLNKRYLLTASQPVYTSSGQFVAAHQLRVGSAIVTGHMKSEMIESVTTVEGYFEVYALTTDHESHNYIVEGLLCHNVKLGD